MFRGINNDRRIYINIDDSMGLLKERGVCWTWICGCCTGATAVGVANPAPRLSI